jgi:xanthine permease XanP
MIQSLPPGSQQNVPNHLTTGLVKMKKPATMVYGVDERPPITLRIVTGIQHVGVIAMFLIYPLVVSNQAKLDAEEVINILQMGMLVLAAAVLLQGLPHGPVGSRFLAPSIFTGVFLAPTMMAVKVGGMPLVWGMTIFSGVVEVLLSRIWSHLRVFIPPEAAGLVVSLVGIIIGLAALHLVLDHSADGIMSSQDGIVVGVSLGVMIGLNIWNKGKLRLLCILIGMLAGYAVGAAIGQITPNDIATVISRPVFSIPTVKYLRWTFDWSMVIPFAVSGLAAAMSATAVITTYQRLNDAEWVRPEPTSLTRGLLGEGIANMAAGLLGAVGLTISTANVGLVAATGVSSRTICYAISAILAAFAFLPIVIGFFTIMPRGVMASVLLFTAVFIIIGGFNIISSRILDARRTLVVGMGLLTFIFVTVAPTTFTGGPNWAQPLVTSPLVLATLVTLVLNGIFRLGIRRTVVMTIDPAAADYMAVANFIEQSAGAWGARRDIMTRASFAAHQAVEAVVEYCSPQGPITLRASFDEFDVDLQISYLGVEFQFPDRPPNRQDLLTSKDGQLRLAGYLIRRQADRVTNASGESTFSLHFKH